MNCYPCSISSNKCGFKAILFANRNGIINQININTGLTFPFRLKEEQAYEYEQVFE
jgi:hypothetical protein